MPIQTTICTNLLCRDICFPAPGAQGNAFWSVGVEMARKEGIMSLMGGLSASMVREVVYSGIRMGTYEYFKDKWVLILLYGGL